jgi:hypothetical protein
MSRWWISNRFTELVFRGAGADLVVSAGPEDRNPFGREPVRGIAESGVSNGRNVPCS